MKIIKFIIPSLLLFMPIGVFAGGCDYETEATCTAAAASGCYWSSGIDPVLGPISECDRCFSGEYSTGDKCELCPAGSYCVNGVRFYCPDGTYSDDKELTTSEGCMPCPAGSYCKNGQKTLCPAGKYSESNASICSDCPAGTYSGVVGLTTEAGCTPCEVGKYNNQPGRTSACDAQCTGPSLPTDVWSGGNYSFEFTSGGSSATSCPWIFSCNAKNVYPVCDDNGCRCESCGLPYEATRTEKEKTIIFDGKDIKPDPDSAAVCPVFSPLELRSDPMTPAMPVGNYGTFVFYAIVRDNQVLISAKNDPEPANYGNEIQIQNVALSNGVNYDVKLSIGQCKFETIGCGSARISTCTVKVSNELCSAAALKTAAGNYSQVQLRTIWAKNVPVLIAKTKLIFTEKDWDNKLHIRYFGGQNNTRDDTTCFKWAENTAEVGSYKNGEPELGSDCSDNEKIINDSMSGYNKPITGSNDTVPFLGYTIGCWRKYKSYEQVLLDQTTIMLEEDFLNFKYPSGCSTQSDLAKSPDEAISGLSSIENMVWPGSASYSYSNIGDTLSAAETEEELDKRCFIVGLYGYPPCTPGCYCPQDGESIECAPSAPFTSDRGSVKRSDCYPKSDVRFKEGSNDVTERVMGYFQRNGSYNGIKLLDE